MSKKISKCNDSSTSKFVSRTSVPSKKTLQINLTANRNPEKSRTPQLLVSKEKAGSTPRQEVDLTAVEIGGGNKLVMKLPIPSEKNSELCDEKSCATAQKTSAEGILTSRITEKWSSEFINASRCYGTVESHVSKIPRKIQKGKKAAKLGDGQLEKADHQLVNNVALQQMIEETSRDRNELTENFTKNKLFEVDFAEEKMEQNEDDSETNYTENNLLEVDLAEEKTEQNKVDSEANFTENNLLEVDLAEEKMEQNEESTISNLEYDSGSELPQGTLSVCRRFFESSLNFLKNKLQRKSLPDPSKVHEQLQDQKIKSQDNVEIAGQNEKPEKEKPELIDQLTEHKNNTFEEPGTSNTLSQMRQLKLEMSEAYSKICELEKQDRELKTDLMKSLVCSKEMNLLRQYSIIMEIQHKIEKERERRIKMEKDLDMIEKEIWRIKICRSKCLKKVYYEYD